MGVARTEVRRCLDCSERFEVLEDLRAQHAAQPYTSLDRRARDIDDLACPACRGERFEVMLSVGQGIQMGGDAGVGRDFPYFDRGLGMHILSAQHRAQVCRSRGLVPMEESGAKAIGDVYRARELAAERDEAAYNEMRREQEADPVMREAAARMQTMLAGAKNPAEARRMAGARRR
jgi:hypothetical protein